MRKYISLFSLLAACLLFGGINASAQSKTFSDTALNYTFEIPEDTWKVVARPPAAQNVEMVYGDRQDGHFEIRRVTTSDEETITDVITRDQDSRLQHLPGYVAGKEESFSGNLKGKIFNYEYTKAGKNMSGRVYFLKSDAKTIYAIRFTGLREKLRAIRNQTDLIARTFTVK